MTDDRPSPWAEIVGPCYTVTSMARTLGWTESEVMQAGRSLHLLALEASDGVTLYPAFQLHDGWLSTGSQRFFTFSKPEPRAAGHGPSS